MNSPSHSVLIHGPQGCGKTRNAKALMRHFGMSVLVDDVLPGQHQMGKPGILYLTYMDPKAFGKLDFILTVSFEAAMQQIGTKA